MEAPCCYICIDEGGDLVTGVCKCTSHMHVACQRRLIKTSHSCTCRVCRSEYTNAAIDAVWYYVPANHTTRLALVCIPAIVVIPPCLVPLFFDLVDTPSHTMILASIVVFLGFWTLLVATFAYHARHLRFRKHRSVWRVRINAQRATQRPWRHAIDPTSPPQPPACVHSP